MPPPLFNTRDTQAAEHLNGKLSEPLQQRIKLMMEFFLALASWSTRQRRKSRKRRRPAMSVVPEASADGNARIFGMGRRQRNIRSYAWRIDAKLVLDPCAQKQKMKHIR